MWMNVLLIRYLTNIVISFTTVTLMLTVQTPKDHSIARVLLVFLVMESRVLVGDADNATYINQPNVLLFHYFYKIL